MHGEVESDSDSRLRVVPIAFQILSPHYERAGLARVASDRVNIRGHKNPLPSRFWFWILAFQGWGPYADIDPLLKTRSLDFRRHDVDENADVKLVVTLLLAFLR